MGQYTFMNPLLAVWLCWAIVGFSPIAGRYAVGVVSPALLVLLGTLVAVAFFAPGLTRRKQWGELFAPDVRWKFLFIGTFGTALPFSILLWALHYTTPGNAAILQQSELLYSLLIAFIFLKEIPSRQQLLGSALILGGVVLILLKEQYTPRWTGDLMVVGCTWMLQAASCLAKKLPKRLDHRLIAAARNIYALPAVLLIVAVLAAQGGMTFRPGVKAFGVLFYTGIFKYGWAMILWYQALRALDLSKITAIYLSYPVLSFVLSLLLGLETPHVYQFAGLGLTLAGAYWVSLIVKKQQERS